MVEHFDNKSPRVSIHHDKIEWKKYSEAFGCTSDGLNYASTSKKSVTSHLLYYINNSHTFFKINNINISRFLKFLDKTKFKIFENNNYN